MTAPQPAAARTIASRDEAIKLCAQMHELTARLTDVMRQETELLKARRLTSVVDMQEEKLSLTSAFLRHFTALKDNAAFVGANAPSQLDRLRRALRTFGQSLQDNLDALEAARAVSQGLVNAMFDIAKKANAGPERYGADAGVTSGNAVRPTALAVNRTL